MSEIIGRLEETSGGKFVHLYHNNGRDNLLARTTDLPEHLQKERNVTETDYETFGSYGIPFRNGPC
jgi:hypothetical protein